MADEALRATIAKLEEEVERLRRDALFQQLTELREKHAMLEAELARERELRAASEALYRGHVDSFDADRLKLMLAVSDALMSEGELEERLKACARCLAPGFADLAFVDLRDARGAVVRLATVSRRDVSQFVAESFTRLSPGDGALDRAVLENAAATRALLAVLAAQDGRDATLAELAPVSVILSPIVAEGVALGRFGLVRTKASPAFAAGDVEVAGRVAARAATAVRAAQRERAAKSAAAAAREVSAIVAHGMEQPLTGVTVAIERMLRTARELLSENDQLELVRMKIRVDQLRRLLDDLGDASGTLDLRQTTCEPGDLLRSAAGLMQAHATLSGARITVAPLEAGLQVRCDRERVLQVMSNLIANAIAHGREPGRVTLSAAPEPDQPLVRFTVRDDGKGMTKDRVYAQFAMQWNDRPIEPKRSGLGLVVSKRIIEAHGGTVWVEAHEEQGTRVNFTLPRPS